MNSEARLVCTVRYHTTNRPSTIAPAGLPTVLVSCSTSSALSRNVFLTVTLILFDSLCFHSTFFLFTVPPSSPPPFSSPPLPLSHPCVDIFVLPARFTFIVFC